MTRYEPPTQPLEVSDGIVAWVQHEGTWWINNAGFLVADSGVVAVDACSTEARTRALLAGIRAVTTQPVRTLVNTHHYGDHTFGNYLFEPATIGAVLDRRRLGRDPAVSTDAHLHRRGGRVVG